MYKDAVVNMETVFGDGSSGSASGGFMDKLVGAGKRLITGESLFMTVFLNQGSGKKRAAFGAPYPGKIIPVALPDVGGVLIARAEWVLYLFGAFLLYTAWKLLRHADEPADPEIAFLRVVTCHYVRDLDEKHHVVLERPQRERRRDRESDRNEAKGQHSLLPGFHALSSSALIRTSISLYTAVWRARTRHSLMISTATNISAVRLTTALSTGWSPVVTAS